VRSRCVQGETSGRDTVRCVRPRAVPALCPAAMLPPRGQRVCRAQYPVGSRRTAPGQTPLTPAALAAPRLPRGAGEGSGVRGPSRAAPKQGCAGTWPGFPTLTARTGHARVTRRVGHARPLQGWRWSIGYRWAMRQTTVGSRPHPRRSAVCVTPPCRQARVCHRWRARPVEAPSPCIALPGTPSTFSV